MSKPRIAILGAGPAGLGAAWWLRRTDKADVVVIERQDRVGGQAGSFEIAGVRVDHGSHRLHPACEPRILKDIRSLLGDDLLDRPRHGRIRLRRRWIHFPLRPFNLVTHLPPSFTLGVARDALSKFLPNSNHKSGETFESILLKGLGRTICCDFYFPYARKLWGLPTVDLSPTQARRRVSAGSLGKMVRKVLPLPGGKKPAGRKGRFYYPRKGFGQIADTIAAAAADLGADIRLDTDAKQIKLGTPHKIELTRDGHNSSIDVDYVWTTLPITVLSRMMQPEAPPEVLEAAQNIQYRGMILIYLVLEQDQFTPFDAHYFPETQIPLSRLSEPKNYSAQTEPRGRTVLCGELPCSVGDELWNADDEVLGERVRESLDLCGLPIRAPVLSVMTRRLPCAYPIYTSNYEKSLTVLDQWATGLDRVLTFGRQGLFAHDNTHHALAMADGAVDCLESDGSFDQAKWAGYRKQFESHVVED